MMTVRPGVYMPYEAAEDRKAEVRYFDDIVLPESKIEVIESVPASNETDSIRSRRSVRKIHGPCRLEDHKYLRWRIYL